MLNNYNFSYNAILWANPLAHPKVALYFKSSPYESSIARLEHTTAETETTCPVLVQLCQVTRNSYTNLLLKTKLGRNTASSTHFEALDPFYSFRMLSTPGPGQYRLGTPSPPSATTPHFILSMLWPSTILRLIFFILHLIGNSPWITMPC